MSLIQQALKRKLEEQQGREVPPPPPPLANAPIAEVPPPLPPETRTAHPKMTLSPQGGGVPPPPPVSLRPTEAPPAAAAAAPASASTAPLPPQHIEAPPARKGPRIAAVLVFLLVLSLGAAVLYFGRGLFAGVRSQTLADTTPAAVIEATKKLSEVPVGPSSAVATAAAPAPAAAATASAPAAGHPATPAWVPLPNVGDVHTRVDTMKGKVTEVRSQTDAVLDDKGTQPAATSGAGSAAPVAATGTPAQPAPSASGVVRSPSGDVVWPSVRLTGVMARGARGEKTALLNEAVVGVGESVDGISLIEVRDNGVMLEYKGDQRFFPLGRRR